MDGLMKVPMRNSLRLTGMLNMVLFVSACASTVDMSAPDVAACNVGGPLHGKYRPNATAPNPQAIPGRPVDCAMGPDGVLRLYPPGTR